MFVLVCFCLQANPTCAFRKSWPGSLFYWNWVYSCVIDWFVRGCVIGWFVRGHVIDIFCVTSSLKKSNMGCPDMAAPPTVGENSHMLVRIVTCWCTWERYYVQGSAVVWLGNVAKSSNLTPPYFKFWTRYFQILLQNGHKYIFLRQNVQ